jgi:hypothetical protein
VPITLDADMRARAQDIADSGKELEQQGGLVGLGVRRDLADDLARDAVERLLCQRRWPRLLRRW